MPKSRSEQATSEIQATIRADQYRITQDGLLDKVLGYLGKEDPSFAQAQKDFNGLSPESKQKVFDLTGLKASDLSTYFGAGRGGRRHIDHLLGGLGPVEKQLKSYRARVARELKSRTAG